MDKYKVATIALLGVTLGMACGEAIRDTALPDAHAAAGNCDRWRVTTKECDDSCETNSEPFAYFFDGNHHVVTRRCLD